MRLLILGGTIFLGRHLAEQGLARGYEVTLFNRGKHGQELFPGAERIVGDRLTDLDRLGSGRWDAAIDTCGYFPRAVSASAEALADRVDHYTFVSSVSVYASFAHEGIDETAPVGRLDNPLVEEVTNETYGPLKALCEEAVEAAMPGGCLAVRPGLIVGPHDPSDRFTYWPCRIDRGGDALAPQPQSAQIQIIDARDLASWMLDLAEQRVTGVFNATGPDAPLTMGEVLETCVACSGSPSSLTWVPEEFLLRHEVTPWSDLPLWIPSSDAESIGLDTIDSSKAVQSGLRHRPLREIVADTLSWARARPDEHTWRAGLTPERETALLEAWCAETSEGRAT